MNLSALLAFFADASLITYLVLGWLSFYFILAFAILFSRLSYLAAWRRREQESLEDLLLGKKDILSSQSILRKCSELSLNHLQIYKNLASRRASAGLTWLSIIASTSPFIGLFGTVISILETFAGLGGQNSLALIAPKISEALIATGCGILVAIPAYSFHLLIKRRAFELLSVLDSQIRILAK